MDEFEQVLLVIGNVAVLLMVIPLAVFISLYRSSSPWRDNELGIALMFQKIALMTMVLVIIAGNFLPPDWDLLRRSIRAVLFFGVLFFLIVDVFNLWEYQHGRRNALFFRFLTTAAEQKRRRARALAKRRP